MKLIKYGFGILLSVLLVTSCASKWPEYKVVNEDVSWESEGTTFSLNPEETPITISLQRGVATEALSVPFEFTDDEGVYTISDTKLDFAVGEYKKTITLTYDYSTLEPGVEYTFNLKFNDTEIKLQLAKGTTDYYKMIFFDGVEFEFKNTADGSDENVLLNKYTGYNEGLSVSSLSPDMLSFTFTSSENDNYIFHTYANDLENAVGYLDYPDIQPGDEFWLFAYMSKNGSWMNITGTSIYPFYHVIEFM